MIEARIRWTGPQQILRGLFNKTGGDVPFAPKRPDVKHEKYPNAAKDWVTVADKIAEDANLYELLSLTEKPVNGIAEKDFFTERFACHLFNQIWPVQQERLGELPDGWNAYFCDLVEHVQNNLPIQTTFEHEDQRTEHKRSVDYAARQLAIAIAANDISSDKKLRKRITLFYSHVNTTNKHDPTTPFYIPSVNVVLAITRFTYAHNRELATRRGEGNLP